MSFDSFSIFSRTSSKMKIELLLTTSLRVNEPILDPSA